MKKFVDVISVLLFEFCSGHTHLFLCSSLSVVCVFVCVYIASWMKGDF